MTARDDLRFRDRLGPQHKILLISGAPGAAGRIALASGKVLKGKGKQIVPAGDRLVLELPGGGGLGRCEQKRPSR